jgi:LPS sulfotransferase NodH
MTPEKADAMRIAIAFIRAVSTEKWDDASAMLHAAIEGDNPAQQVAQVMGAMATLMCQVTEIDDDWADTRLRMISYLETHPDEC